MAGHSKWANIKHKKAKEDAKRGQVFTKVARQITISVKESGADPESNLKLRLAIEKARAVNMPNDNIERAINRGIGGLDGANYEEITYEGYGPNGVAILLDVLTDNRNRAASEIRHCFSKHGGNLGESGCVAWMFEKKGLIVIDDEGIDHDEIFMVAVEAGAEDVEFEDGIIKVITEPSNFSDVKKQLEEQYELMGSELSMIPKNTVEVSKESGETIEKLISALEDLDDVQEVYANYDIVE